MRRRFYFILLFLVLVLFALPGFAAKAAKRTSSRIRIRAAFA